MAVRVVDYIGNEGGGVRFSVELLRALAARSDVSLEFVSHGPALDAYRALVGGSAGRIAFRDLPPGAADGWRFDVPAAALDDCAVVWLPWVHRHRLPDADVAHVVGSFHDAIMLAEPTVRAIFARHLPDEMETTRRWVDSAARVVVSSRATVGAMRRLFDAPAERYDVVPVSGAHAGPAADALPAAWAWADEPFIVCPANTSPHKNHDVLLAGVGRWGGADRHPLVLTGSGADLALSPNPVKAALRPWLETAGLLRRIRATDLRRAARRAGLRRGRSLVPVGYVSDARYYALLARAWALVMPTLAEGGGSFPVEEALWAGVPVVCSDIPVLREHVERLGASVLWFDPRRPDDLAARLAELEAGYADHKARAVSQRALLRRRTWADVADEYWSIFTAAAPAARR
jgi:glycosyltransferase involved in cell wall biosynthesis